MRGGGLVNENNSNQNPGKRFVIRGSHGNDGGAFTAVALRPSPPRAIAILGEDLMNVGRSHFAKGGG